MSPHWRGLHDFRALEKIAGLGDDFEFVFSNQFEPGEKATRMPCRFQVPGSPRVTHSDGEGGSVHLNLNW